MLKVNQKLYDEILAYCKLNKIEDVNNFCNKLLESAFTVEKYGSVPEIVIQKVEEPKVEVKEEPKERIYSSPKPYHPWRGKMRGRGVLVSKI